MIHRWKYCLELAFKDLAHHGLSTGLIVVVVALICLPLIIVSSLREGYVAILKNSIENSSQAKRIDIAVSIQRGEELYINSKRLAQFRAMKGVAEVVPQKSRTVYLLDANDNEIDFEMITTIPTDPDLKRFGFQGRFSQAEVDDLTVIAREQDILEKLGLEKIPETLTVIVKRTVQGRLESYVLPCKVIGTLQGGPPNRLYVPLGVGNQLERWTLGFGVPELKLPPAPNREQALGRPTAETALAVATQPLDESSRHLLQRIGMVIEDVNDDNGFFRAALRPIDPDKKVTEGVCDSSEAALAQLSNAKVFPAVPPLTIAIGDKEILLSPSVTADPRREALLAPSGSWINRSRDRFELTLSQEHAPELGPLPALLEATLNGNDLRFTVVGVSQNERSYVDYETLFRLHQLAEGKATYSLDFNAFDYPEKTRYDDRFLFARVFAHKLEDVQSLVAQFEGMGYEIYASSRADVQNFESTNTILRNLMLLVLGFGLLAVIASVFVLMLEAIKRKKNEIGIMRAMGLSKWFLTRVFLFESLAYGIGGTVLSLLLFLLLARSTLDSDIGHRFLAVSGLEGRIFSLSPGLVLFLFILIAAVSLLAGLLASGTARNVDPADILS